jgi:hypothetical protein
MMNARKNKWSLHSLVSFALQNWKSDACWDAITELHGRGFPDALKMAQRLARSRNWRKRALGLYTASPLRRRIKSGCFGSVEYAMAETQALLLHGLDDPRTEVVRAAISGFGQRPLPEALPRLISLAADTDRETRLEVAIALGKYGQDEATETLLALARDPWHAVRDWATFGIGTQRKADSPVIRELLWTNLHDEDENVRGEALVGLADPVLLERLEALQQALKLGESLDVDSYWHHCLTDAIDACRKTQNVERKYGRHLPPDRRKSIASGG